MAFEAHKTAIVEDGAEIGDGCVIGPYSIIRSGVRLGIRNVIGPHVVIEGNTTIGDENRIFQFASVGSIPQDLKYHGEPSRLVIGSRNIIREYVTMQPGTEGGGMLTKAGNANLFMANCHLGHDSQMGDCNVVANSTAIAGHVTIGSRTLLGGICAVHQFVRLGDFSLLSGGAMVAKDVPPFCIAQGDRACLVGVNQVGMERAGYSNEDILRTRKLFRDLYVRKGSFQDRLNIARESYADFGPAQMTFSFIEGTIRGMTVFKSRVQDSSAE